MIKFFRKIRQRLLIQNRLSKYLLYAVGEIVLVVIGILIALQVNNWNNERKLRHLEKDLLYGIRDNLLASKNNLDANIAYNENTIVNFKRITDFIETGLPYDSALDSSFSYLSYWSEPSFTYTAYETLKSTGMDIIQNDSIKLGITEIYEEFFPWVTLEYRAEWELHQSSGLPFVMKHIKYSASNRARPNDFETLKLNTEFHNLLGFKMVTRQHSIYFSSIAREKVIELISDIDKELKIKHDQQD